MSAVEVSLLEAGLSYFWTAGMREHTFLRTDSKEPVAQNRYIFRLRQGAGPEGKWRDPLCGFAVLRPEEVMDDPLFSCWGKLLKTGNRSVQMMNFAATFQLGCFLLADTVADLSDKKI